MGRTFSIEFESPLYFWIYRFKMSTNSHCIPDRSQIINTSEKYEFNLVLFALLTRSYVHIAEPLAFLGTTLHYYGKAVAQLSTELFLLISYKSQELIQYPFRRGVYMCVVVSSCLRFCRERHNRNRITVVLIASASVPPRSYHLVVAQLEQRQTSCVQSGH